MMSYTNVVAKVLGLDATHDEGNETLRYIHTRWCD